MARNESRHLKSLLPETLLQSSGIPLRQRLRRFLMPFLLGSAITALIGAVLLPASAWSGFKLHVAGATAARAVGNSETGPDLWRVVAMTEEDLGHVDVGHLNLLCATGLPGSESLDIAACRRQLDKWAEMVRFETQRHLYKFQQKPEEYEGSEAYFRMLSLVSVLQLDLGVHYNMDRVRNVDFTSSSDLFIHGMLDSNNGGTCVSMPVLYTAVARRLGYPVKLVLAKGHVFCRWEDGSERMNLEGSGRGLSVFPDSHYQNWPLRISDAEVARGDYLRSLTPRQELALFLSARAHCLQDNGRVAEALVAYAHAHALDPGRPESMAFLEDAVRRSNPRRAQADRQVRMRQELAQEENVDLRNQLRRERHERELLQLQELNRKNRTDSWNPSPPASFAQFPPDPTPAISVPGFPLDPVFPQ